MPAQAGVPRLNTYDSNSVSKEPALIAFLFWARAYSNWSIGRSSDFLK
jgi:hypothetical protein